MGIEPKNVQEYRVANERRGVSPVESRYKRGHSRLSLVIRHPCETCNNTWLSRLEEAVAPTLTPMMEGVPLNLDFNDCRVLRAWASKMALQFAYAGERGFSYPIPERFAQELYAGRDSYDPVRFVKVWVAKYDPLGQFAYRHMVAQGYGVIPTNGEIHQVIRVIFIAGHAAFYVRLPDVASAQPLAWTQPLPSFRPLHSVQDGQSVPWSGGILDDGGVSQAMNLHINADIYPHQSLGTWTGMD